MRRLTASLLTVCALTFVPALSAQAQANDALDRVLEGGALERLVAGTLARIDVDALIAGFERAAEAAARGQTVDPAEFDRLGRHLDRQLAESAPQLARGAVGLPGPVLRELRAELGRELATAEGD